MFTFKSQGRSAMKITEFLQKYCGEIKFSAALPATDSLFYAIQA